MRKFDFDNITNRQIAEIEDVTGKSFTDIVGKWEFKVACAYLVLRESDPNITYEQVLDGSWETVADAMAGADPKDVG